MLGTNRQCATNLANRSVYLSVLGSSLQRQTTVAGSCPHSNHCTKNTMEHRDVQIRNAVDRFGMKFEDGVPCFERLDRLREAFNSVADSCGANHLCYTSTKNVSKALANASFPLVLYSSRFISRSPHWSYTVSMSHHVTESTFFIIPFPYPCASSLLRSVSRFRGSLCVCFGGSVGRCPTYLFLLSVTSDRCFHSSS